MAMAAEPVVPVWARTGLGGGERWYAAIDRPHAHGARDRDEEPRALHQERQPPAWPSSSPCCSCTHSCLTRMLLRPSATCLITLLLNVRVLQQTDAQLLFEQNEFSDEVQSHPSAPSIPAAQCTPGDAGAPAASLDVQRGQDARLSCRESNGRTSSRQTACIHPARAWQDSQILLDLLFNAPRGGRRREAAPLHPPHALLGGPASRLSPR